MKLRASAGTLPCVRPRANRASPPASPIRPVEHGPVGTRLRQPTGADLASDASLSTLDAGVLDNMFSIIQANRGLRWKIVQRGFWANGASGRE